MSSAGCDLMLHNMASLKYSIVLLVSFDQNMGSNVLMMSKRWVFGYESTCNNGVLNEEKQQLVLVKY